MNTDGHERLESASRDENTRDADRQVVGRRGSILRILIAAIVVAELSKDVIFIFSVDRGDWLPAWEFVYYGMTACLPFLLARMAPKAAGFDTQWLPSSRRQWAWFFGMLFLLIVARVLVAALAATIVGDPSPVLVHRAIHANRQSFSSESRASSLRLSPKRSSFAAISWNSCENSLARGIALLIQALLFGLFHLYTWGLFTSLALINSVNAFVLGMILGVWRIKFRSLLPLVLAHVLLNATAIVPLKARYDQAVDRSHPQYTISKETTYITEPLRKDGFVDYVAALNQRSSQGVTPENNAAVLFWKAMGPEEIEPEYRDKYFQMLGIPPLPEKGDYFVDLEQYLARKRYGVTRDDANSKPENQGRCVWIC